MKTILVVDDMAVIRDLIAAALQSAGYQTACAADGREALGAIRTAQPDLILLDVLMPGMGGLEFLRHLRAEPSTAKTPVILLSAAEGKRDVLAAAQYHVSGYLLKSRLSLKDLLARVKARLEGPTAATAAAAPAGSAVGATTPPKASPAAPAQQTSPTEPSSPEQQPADPAAQGPAALSASPLAGQVAALAGSSLASASKLAVLIAQDPVLADLVIQAANRVAQAKGGKVISGVPDAVRLIGCSGVRDVAAAAAAAHPTGTPLPAAAAKSDKAA